MVCKRLAGAAGVILGAAVLAAGCAPQGQSGPKIFYGDAQGLGEGTVRTWLEASADGTLEKLGVEMSKSALSGLPVKRNMTSRCFDVNGNGVLDPMECEGDEERKLSLPAEAAALGVTFSWVSVNFNPEGHIPENWTVPHFDFHFYLAPKEEISAIRTGQCGILINCDDFETAVKPVPAKYTPPDYISIDAAVSEMGNHLIDSTSPQMGPPFAKAEHVVIYGAYDGHIIFIEPMITSETLMNNPNTCFEIKQPEAWEASGYYPAEYCITADDARYYVSLSGLTYHEAS